MKANEGLASNILLRPAIELITSIVPKVISFFLVNEICLKKHVMKHINETTKQVLISRIKHI
jgi:hypothetical protein